MRAQQADIVPGIVVRCGRASLLSGEAVLCEFCAEDPADLDDSLSPALVTLCAQVLANRQV